MAYFDANMHQIRFRLGRPLDSTGGAYSASPDTLTGFQGRSYKAKEGGEKWRGGEGK